MIKVLSTVRPKNLVIMAAFANAAEDLGITTTITVGSNGKHMVGSKHYDGNALDIRSKDLQPSIKILLLSKALVRLGKGYEGFLEADGKANEHFHVEYDPK